MLNFEKLKAWQDAIRFSRSIYSVTRTIPDDEKYGLTSQLRRASVSISANIAEGNGRRSKADYLRFVEIAYGSLMETVSHLAIAVGENYLAEHDHARLYRQAEELARMLSGLRSSLKG
ncbi:four helix bundle protein [Stratiformator vulcanicus]|uniref:Four helix bundle protein n=1 Tax=Stratiformator vulcanicus TaxID=2527980 RepID=A0A517QXX9_9PLAN|nr:four helix bundle protein [Stratiformator vulcanicus]QDT36430.1 hypothetical protein Pan189_07860 [Stratiformator vulcanicus]